MALARRLLALPAVLAALAAGPADAQAGPAASCLPKGGTPLGASTKLVVFARGKARRVVLCRPATGRRQRLGWMRPREEYGYAIRSVTVSRHAVAYVQDAEAFSSQGPFAPDKLALVDGRSGRVAEIDPGCAVSPATDRAVVIGGFGLKGRTLVWSCTNQDMDGYRTEVLSLSPQGRTLLDASGPTWGPGIDFQSLVVGSGEYRVADARAYWRHGDELRSADLR